MLVTLHLSTVSHAFGYGLMDAYEMVKQAADWTLVPAQRRCSVSVIVSDHAPRFFSSTQPLTVPVEVNRRRFLSACASDDMR